MDRDEMETFLAEEFQRPADAEDVDDTVRRVQRRADISSTIRRAILVISIAFGGVAAFFLGRLLLSMGPMEPAVTGTAPTAQGGLWLLAILFCAALIVIAAVYSIVRDR